MIFVGSGALLWRAVATARTRELPVDLVLHPDEEAPEWASDVPRTTVAAVDDHADEMVARTGADRLVWSINNPFLFGRDTLATGLTILNVHGGTLPDYRGLPLAICAHAVLRGEASLEAVVHGVDDGIDTGPVYARRAFDIASSATLEDVLLDLTDNCHTLYADLLDSAVHGRLSAEPRATRKGGYYGRRSLAALAHERDHPRFDQATDLGFLGSFGTGGADQITEMRKAAGLPVMS